MSGPHDGRTQRARPARSASGPRRPLRGAALAGATALGAAYLLCVGAAQAEPQRRPSAARLDYVLGRGAERCPDASFLRAEVARVAGADPFRDDAPLLVSARIERQGAELAASLALRDGEGKTRWADGFSTGSACEALVAGMGLAIATRLLRVPERASREPSPPEAPQGPGPAEPTQGPPGPAEPAQGSPGPAPPAQGSPGPAEPAQGSPGPAPPAQGSPGPAPPAQALQQPPGALPPTQAARAAPAPSGRVAPAPPSSSGEGAAAGHSEPLRIEAGLGATAGLGITPGIAAGTTLAVGVRWSDWSIAVEGRGLASLSKEIADMDISTTAFTVAAVACRRGQLMFGCGLGAAGAVRFVPRDPWNMRVRSKALLGMGARLGSAWPLSDMWSVHGHFEAIWIVEDALLRRQGDGSKTPASPSWSSPPLAAALGLGFTAMY
ncbi:hypothetical protein WMF30_25975 [Sorangium sp. So ce134]